MNFEINESARKESLKSASLWFRRALKDQDVGTGGGGWPIPLLFFPSYTDQRLFLFARKDFW